MNKKQRTSTQEPQATRPWTKAVCGPYWQPSKVGAELVGIFRGIVQRRGPSVQRRRVSMTRLSAIDVCAGAGLLSHGLDLAGFDTLGVELDRPACETHRRNVGACIEADVTTWEVDREVDLVAGGVPCQSWSLAGKGAGFDDPRGMLYLALLHIAVAADARAVLLENVRGLVSRGALPTLYDAFRVHGYEPAHAILDAASYGTPQRRHRLFVVGFRRAVDLARFRWPAPTHGLPGTPHVLPWVTVRQALDLKGGAASVLDQPAPTISAGGTDMGGAEPITNQTTRRRLMHALAVYDQGRAGSEPHRLDKPSPTVTTTEEKGTRASPSSNWTSSDGPDRASDGLYLANGRRRLTVAECAALQGCPARWTWPTKKKDAYKQIGNGVAIQLAQAVGGAIFRVLVSSR